MKRRWNSPVTSRIPLASIEVFEREATKALTRSNALRLGTHQLFSRTTSDVSWPRCRAEDRGATFESQIAWLKCSVEERRAVPNLGLLSRLRTTD